MNNQSGILYTCISILAMTLLLSGSSPAATPTPLPNTAPANPPAETAPAESVAAGSSKDACLGCHRSFDKLISATADYMMKSGDKDIKCNPHRYEPHDSKDIPECGNCHQPHPVPLTTTEGLPKPDVQWCYSCHHAGLVKCGDCHQ